MWGVLNTFLVVVEVLTSALLVGVILLQRAKAHGAGMAFGQAMGESLFGAQAGNVLTKATVVLASIFLVNTTVLTLMATKSRVSSVIDSSSVPVMPGLPPGARPAEQGVAQPAQAPAAAQPPSALPVADAGAGAPVAPFTANAGPVEKVGGDKPAANPETPAATGEKIAE